MKLLLVLPVFLAYLNTTQAQTSNEMTMFASYNNTFSDMSAYDSNAKTTKVPDLNYRVLLGVFTHRIPIESDYWEAVRSDLSVITETDHITYTVGCYRNYTEAERKCKELIGKGYLYATVTAFSADRQLKEVGP